MHTHLTQFFALSLDPFSKLPGSDHQQQLPSPSTQSSLARLWRCRDISDFASTILHLVKFQSNMLKHRRLILFCCCCFLHLRTLFVLLLNVFLAVKCHGHGAWWPSTPFPLSSASHRCDPPLPVCRESGPWSSVKYLEIPKALHSIFASAVACSAAGLHQNICSWDFPYCIVYLLHPGFSEPLKPAGKISYF